MEVIQRISINLFHISIHSIFYFSFKIFYALITDRYRPFGLRRKVTLTLIDIYLYYVQIFMYVIINQYYSHILLWAGQQHY